jgi:hypothetical protein
MGVFRRDSTIVARYGVPGIGLKGGSSRRDRMNPCQRFFYARRAPILSRRSYRTYGTESVVNQFPGISCLGLEFGPEEI